MRLSLVPIGELTILVSSCAQTFSPAYREALKVLGNACERDVRIVGGLG